VISNNPPGSGRGERTVGHGTTYSSSLPVLELLVVWTTRVLVRRARARTRSACSRDTTVAVAPAARPGALLDLLVAGTFWLLQSGLALENNLVMPEALDITCPCCGSLLKIDPETGAIVWSEDKKAPPKDFDDLVNRVHAQKDALAEKFARSMEQNKKQRDILDKKFEEAKKRAAADPNPRPFNPFDLD
jgi:hypothetical protein